MKFSISRDALVKPLNLVAGVVERRQTLPILSNVLLSLEGKKLSLTGTDLEVELVGRVELDSAGVDGEVTVPARKLVDICKSLPDGSIIELSVESGKATVKAGRSRFTLSTLAATEFPSVEEGVGELALDLPQTTVKRLIERTAFAMAQQDVRYFFNGMLFELDGEKFKLVATNGQRLAVVASDSTGSHLKGRPIVPRKGVLELAKLLDGVDGDIKLSFSETCFVADMAGKRFISKLIDGEYPDYTKAIPSETDKLVVCDRQMLREAMVRTAVMSNEVYKNVKLSLKPGSLSLFTNNPLQEQAKESLAVDYSGEALEIGFNVHFLIEALGALSGGTVSMGFSGQTSPCLITDPEDPSTEFVVSPMVI